MMFMVLFEKLSMKLLILNNMLSKKEIVILFIIVLHVLFSFEVVLLRLAKMVLYVRGWAVVNSETKRPNRSQVVGQAGQAPGVHRILIVLYKYLYGDILC